MKKVSFLILFLCAISVFGQALDWKLLHEQADNTTLENIDQELVKDPASVQLQYKKGLICLVLHKDSDAQKLFKKLMIEIPDDAAFVWGYAEVLRRMRKLDESQTLLKKVLTIDKKFAPAYITQAYIYYTQKHYAKAVLYGQIVLKQGLAVDTGNIVRANLIIAGAKGMLAYNGGPFAKVIQGLDIMPHLKKAYALAPNSPGVLFGLGSYYLMAPKIAGGDLDKAQGYLDKAILADPLFADCYVRLGQVYQRRGNKEKYLEYLAKALALDPQNELANDIKSGKCDFICVTTNN